MYYAGFVFREVRWTDDREEHIARHGVKPREVEELLFSRPLWLERKTKEVLVVAGVLSSGRHLVAAVIVEDHQSSMFVVTSRDMTASGKRIYRRRAR